MCILATDMSQKIAHTERHMAHVSDTAYRSTDRGAFTCHIAALLRQGRTSATRSGTLATDAPMQKVPPVSCCDVGVREGISKTCLPSFCWSSGGLFYFGSQSNPAFLFALSRLELFRNILESCRMVLYNRKTLLPLNLGSLGGNVRVTGSLSEPSTPKTY